MLCLEIKEKRNHLEPQYRHLVREATSGFANLSIFWWLTGLLKTGAHKIISINDLDSAGDDFLSERLQTQLESNWSRGMPRSQKMHLQELSNFEVASQHDKHALMFSVAKTFQWSLLAGILPRLCLTGFTYAQPFLMTTLLNNIDATDSKAVSNSGYALIGAYVLVFFGAAVSPGQRKLNFSHGLTYA